MKLISDFVHKATHKVNQRKSRSFFVITAGIFLSLFSLSVQTYKAEASHGGLDRVVITAPNELTATFEHSLATYATSSFTNLGLGLQGRAIVDVVATTSNTITLSFDGPLVAPNTTGSIDIGPIDWSDEPGGFEGGAEISVDDGLIPRLGAITLGDNDNSGGLNAGDTLTFRFNEPMRRDITTGNIGSYFEVADGHSFGTGENGLALSWSNSSTTLTVTIGTDNTLELGDTVTPLGSFSDVAGNVMNNMPPSLEIPFAQSASRTLYFYNPVNQSDWNDINSWWLDPDHTTQASSLPNVYDNVIIDSSFDFETDDQYYVRSIAFSSIGLGPDFVPAYINVHTTNGIIVNDGWTLLGYFVGNTTFNGFSAAGFTPFIGPQTYFGYSTIVGTVNFSGPTNANYGAIYGNTTFNGQYGNAGLIYGNVEFRDITSNPGIIFGHVSFFDNTFNGGFGAGVISGNVDVYSPAQNPLGGTVDGTITYHGYSFDSGTGTEQDPYIITLCQQLQDVKDNLSAHYKLGGNIDCSDSSEWNVNLDEWENGDTDSPLIPDSYATTTHTNIIVQNNGYFGFEPIGTSNAPFTGSLDGDGYTISNIWVFRKTDSNVGLFGYTQGATFRDMTLASSSIVGGSNTGGIAGYIDGGQASHITLNNNTVRAYLQYNGGGFAGNITSGTFSHIQNNGGFVHGSGNIIGGIVGYMLNGTITDSYSSAAVDGGLNVGGFVGQFEGGEITRSFATGNVISNRSEWLAMKTGYNAGGFAGYINLGTISNSYATGNVTTSSSYAGGFVGYASPGVTISNAYATGDVSGVQEVFENATFIPDYIGGFAGYASGSHFSKTFATGNVVSVGMYTGGYAGWLSGVLVQDAYAEGNVTGQGGVGGFAGYMSQDSNVANVYARGAVGGTDPQSNAGLIGVPDNGATTTNSFWDTETVGQPTYSNASEKTTTQMTTQSTFADAGWDFTTTWAQRNGVNAGYPLFIFTLTPEVSVVTPSNSATNVSTTTSIVIRFSVPMSTSTAVISTSPCTESCASYTQTWSDNDQTLTLEKIGSPFAYNTTYMLSITSIRSAGNIGLTEPYTWSFTTRGVEVAIPTSAPSPTPIGGRTGGGSVQWSPNSNVLNLSAISINNTNTANNIASITFTSTRVVKENSKNPKINFCSENIYPTESIKFGAKNNSEQVKLLEKYLNTFENAGLLIDGVYSEKDRTAVISWQEKYSADILAPWGQTKGTGYIYRTSLNKFKSLFLAQCPTETLQTRQVRQNSKASQDKKTSNGRDLQFGMSGEDVKILQKALILKKVGPAAQSLSKNGVSGYFGELTKAAVVEFQVANAIIPAFGSYGPKTKSILRP